MGNTYIVEESRHGHAFVRTLRGYCNASARILIYIYICCNSSRHLNLTKPALVACCFICSCSSGIFAITVQPHKEKHASTGKKLQLKMVERINLLRICLQGKSSRDGKFCSMRYSDLMNPTRSNKRALNVSRNVEY